MQQQQALEHRYGFKLGYLALVETNGAVHTGEMLTNETLQAVLDARASRQSLASVPGGCSPCPWQSFLPKTPVIVVDVTAADGLDKSLTQAVAAGHHVVFANKHVLSGAREVFTALTRNGATRYEATVGAGLPVLDTLQRLLDSGDKMIRIEAAMSGTLGYLCSALEDGKPLSEAVHFAKENGWTEPDPRDDLSGADVARKALILARTCGLPWEMSHVQPEPWFPPEMAKLSVDEFMERLPELDMTYANQIASIRSRDMVMRYVATIEPDKASVGLRELPQDHPLAMLRGTDNMIVFTTERYNDPVPRMVVRGPGAGLDVTAAGVFGDIIATAREMCG
jgi:homoserine dehydrogenase